jgi:hypothetical protein
MGSTEEARLPGGGLRNFTQESGVTILGVQPANTNLDISASLYMAVVRIGVLNSTCESTSGMVLMAGQTDMGKQFRRLITVVRGCYIVEFPRPVGAPGGYHDVEISIDETDAFIRSTGIGVPVYDPALSKDPATVPANP